MPILFDSPEDFLKRCRELYHRHKQTRPHWPASFDDAMNDPIVGRLLELDAKHGITPREGAKRIASEPPEHPQGVPWVFVLPLPGAIDSASLAAPSCKPALASSDPAGHLQAQADAEQPPRRFLSGKDRAAGEREDDDE